MHDSDVRPPSPVFPSAPDAPLPHTGYVLLWFPLASETFIFHEVRRLADIVSHRFAFNSEYARYEGCHAVAYLTRCFARNERIAPDEHQHDYDENCQCNGLFFSFSHKFSCFFPIGWLFFVIGALGGASLQK